MNNFVAVSTSRTLFKGPVFVGGNQVAIKDLETVTIQDLDPITDKAEPVDGLKPTKASSIKKRSESSRKHTKAASKPETPIPKTVNWDEMPCTRTTTGIVARHTTVADGVKTVRNYTPAELASLVHL